MNNDLIFDLDELCHICEHIGRDTLIFARSGNLVVADRIKKLEKQKKALLEKILNNET